MPLDGFPYIRRQPPQLMPAGELELIEDHPSTAGLVGYWPLCGDYSDYSASENDGTPVGSVPFTAAPFGPAITISPSTYVSLAQRNFPTAAATLSVWTVSHDNRGSTPLELSWDPYNKITAGSYLIATFNTDEGPVNCTSVLRPVAGVWYHLVGTYDGTTINLYVNGNLQASAALSGTLIYRSGNRGPGIGGPAELSDPWSGMVSNAAVWNRAMTAGEVARLYAEPFAMLRPKVRRDWYVGASSPSGDMVGDAVSSSSMGGTLAGIGKLDGDLPTASTASATLTATGSLSSAAAANTVASGTIAAIGNLTGDASASAHAATILVGTGSVAGRSAGASAAEASVAGVGALSATSSATADAAGILGGVGALAGMAIGASLVTGTLTDAGSGTMAGSAAAEGDAAAQAIGTGALAGSIVGASATSATLTATGTLTASAAAAAAAAGMLVGFGPISGIAAAVSVASGTLVGAAPIVPGPRITARASSNRITVHTSTNWITLQ